MKLLQVQIEYMMVQIIVIMVILSFASLKMQEVEESIFLVS